MAGAAPDPAAEWWTTTDVAAFLGVRVATVSTYRMRGQMPAPDETYGRTHLWRPQTVVDWHSRRPRPAGNERPASSPPRTSRPASSRRGQPASQWQTHGERNLYDNRWVRLDLVDVELPDGERFEHHRVTLPEAAMTVLLDDDQQRVLLMWRHRFISDVWNWELPGGVVEPAEDPRATAARETEEETGYRPRDLQLVATFEPMIGTVRSPHHVFVSRGAELVGEPTEATEAERLQWHDLGELPDLIAGGGVRNSGTLVGLLHLLAFPPR